MKKNMRKLFALLLVFAMLVTLAACGKKDESAPDSGSSPDSSQNASTADTGSGGGGGASTSSDPAPAVSDRPLRVAVGLDSGTLHPNRVSGSGGFPGVLSTCMEGLFYFNKDGTREWVLATGIDRISDLQYTLYIREGVTFSNGNPLTAEDVLFSMQLCADDPRAFLNVKGMDMEKTKVIDDYSLDVWYTEYNAAADPGLSQLSVMDKESFDDEAMSLNPIGTGPYVITDYVTNSHVTAEARDDYWGEAPAIKRIEFKIINEDAQKINALETGDVDMSYIPLKDAAYVESLGYIVTNFNAGVAMTINFNMTEGTVLGTKEARYAICHAVDRQAIVDIVFDGRSEVLNWPISGACIDFEPRFANVHETYTVGYNPERAKELAEQSGLVGQTLRIITNGSADYITMAEIMQEDLLKIGVNSEIINYDQATYFSLLMDESNYEIAIFNPAAPSVMAADIFGMYLTFIPQGWSGPDRDLYGELSLKALATADDKTRADMINEYLQIFYDFTPWYGLCEGVSMRADSAELRGLEFDLAGNVQFEKLSFAS